MKIVILFLVLINSVFAGECDPINLVTEPNSPFQQIPTMDQDGSNTCYAYSSAQLVNYHFIKKGSKKPVVHHAWLALLARNGAGSLWGSNPVMALMALRDGNNCSMDYVTNSLRRWARLANATESQLLAILDNVTINLQTAKKNLSKEELKSIFYRSVSSAPGCNPDPLWADLAPNLMKLSVINSDKILKEIIFSECKKAPQKLILPPVMARVASPTRMSTLLTINNVLTAHRVPVVVSYCANMLQDPKYQGILMARKDNPIPQKPDCLGHSSVIVGRKKIGNSCHYLLRNSWGTGFSRDNQNYKCLCRNKRTGAYVDNCHISTHNNGEYVVDSCWIPTSQFPMNTYRFTYLK